MEYTVTFQKVINYIDEHIHEAISVDELAKHIGYSSFHFLRVFKEVVGETPREYVTKRKLQFALRDMSRQSSINEIAFHYGYESYAGFSKAFKKVFGMSPATYRMHCPNAEPPIINLEELKENKTGGMIYQPKIVTKDSFVIVGKSYEIQLKDVRTTRDAPTYWYHSGLTDGEIERTLYDTFSPSIHGEFCLNRANEEDWSTFSYFFGVLDENISRPLGDSFERIIIPASTFAVFNTPLVQPDDFVDSVKGTWNYILNYWFPMSGYEIDETSYDFEFYDERCHPWEYELVMMDIYIPIQKKNVTSYR